MELLDTDNASTQQIEASISIEDTSQSVSLTSNQPEAQATEISDPSDYYKSQEYYNWYYSQYYNQAGSTTDQTVYVDPTVASAPGTNQINVAAEDITGLGYADYTVSGGFNPLTGKFQNMSTNARYRPDEYFSQYNKAERQMNFFFDHDAYQQTRAEEVMKKHLEKPKKLTKKEVEMFKQRKKAKKDEKMRKKYAD
ncbi:hypothetical protein HK096_010602 [Nowakowskiella sp. JEL0078]|nr:hypothetical protein HK096_010602 [Nowakowskiella sp. JEL0078]